LIWKEEEEKEEKEEKGKTIAYLIPMMKAIKTAFLSDARELGVKKRKN
jgi:superfamily II DNA/RNA helicase